MPYIVKKERKFLNPHLTDAIDIILSEDTNFKKAETLGIWTYYLCNMILSGSASVKNKNIADHANKVLDYILEPITDDPSENQIFSLAGNLNYSISYVAWGILGDYEKAPKASYGMRCYAAQQIRSVLDNIPNHCDKKCMIVRGVLNDVLDELYRRKTSAYEDKKILENGDLEY